VLDELPDAVTVQSESGLVYANRESLRLLGFDTIEELVATPIEEFIRRFETFDELGRPYSPEDLPGRRVLRGEPYAEKLLRNVVRATGEESWRLVQARPLETADGRLAINVLRDVTELKHAESGLRLLVDVSAALTSSLDIRESVEAVAEVLVPALVDAVLVETAEELLVAHSHEPDLEQALRTLAEGGLTPAARVDQTEMELPELGGVTLVRVPLMLRDESIGTLTLVTTSARWRLGESELTLAELIGRRIATALERAQLHAATEDAQRRLRFAAEASAVLAGSLQYEETLARLLRLAVPELADWCIVDVLEPDGRIDRVAAAAAEPHKQALLDELRRGYPPSLDSPQPASTALRTGETTLFPAFDAESLRATVVDERHLELLEGLAPRTALAVPLVAHGATVGALTLAWSESERAYDADLTERAEELASRAALAVANSRLYLEAQNAQRRLALLARESAELSSSLDYEQTLKGVAELAVPDFADWCVVDVLEDDRLERIAVAHADPAKIELVEELRRSYPPEQDMGPASVARTGQSELLQLSDELLVASARDERHLSLLRALDLGSYICAPMVARGVSLGALTFVAGSSRPAYGDDDLALAEDLARRAATAIDNARLYQQAEERGEAARALAYVGDGVFLVDRQGFLRLWNPAAEAVTGLAAADVIHRPVAEAIPGWDSVALRIPVGSAPGAQARRPETVPLELDGREVWLSIAGVAYPGGTVYAFRDLTEEHRIERLKSDFVSTISHELRTPLAAIYGAALTLRRDDIVLEHDQRDGLLSVIATESDRLARIVHDVLYASRIETGSLNVTIESADAYALARAIVDAARTHKPPGVEIKLSAAKRLPRVAADPDKVSQVLSNLLENAVKYSPEGGEIELRLEPVGRSLRFSVRDQGIGIPRPEHDRIFEKFYRLDPDLTRGVGGTGLGLYICREVIRRMGGRIWVQSRERKGSTFFFELPLV
jgi:PAS domain S-box-containing protein